jgi:3-deoxy-D-manno-octulosonic-acid transferase
MPYILNFVYLLVLIAAAPWLIWSAIRKGKYREGFAAKLLGNVPPRSRNDRRCLWFHAVSVGEVNLLGTLLCDVAAKHPDWECVVSTTTATGYALAKKKYPNLTVFYAPLDFSWVVHRAMRRVRPTVLVLVELELWPNLIRAAKQCGAKVAIVNGRLSELSFRGYRRVGWFARRVLRRIDLIAAQNEEYAERFCALGARPDAVYVIGSLKFDGAQTDRNNEATRRLRALAEFTDDDIVFLVGSTQGPEEELALKTFVALKDKYSRLKLVLVPRHPHRFDEVAAMLDRSGLPWQRRSQLEGSMFRIQGSESSTPHSALRTRDCPFPIRHSPFRILLVDTVGELSAWWGTATIGFVGGSLGSRGGQNMIEPAAYGVATCFGPNTQNFRDIVQMLVREHAAAVVQNGDELTEFVGRCLNDSRFADDMGNKACQLVSSQLGATERTLELLRRQIEPGAAASARMAAA